MQCAVTVASKVRGWNFFVYWKDYLLEANLLINICMHERESGLKVVYCNIPPGNESMALSYLQKVSNWFRVVHNRILQ